MNKTGISVSKMWQWQWIENVISPRAKFFCSYTPVPWYIVLDTALPLTNCCKIEDIFHRVSLKMVSELLFEKNIPLKTVMRNFKNWSIFCANVWFAFHRWTLYKDNITINLDLSTINSYRNNDTWFIEWCKYHECALYNLCAACIPNFASNVWHKTWPSSDMFACCIILFWTSDWVCEWLSEWEWGKVDERERGGARMEGDALSVNSIKSSSSLIMDRLTIN